jgi:hypothetical protein
MEGSITCMWSRDQDISTLFHGFLDNVRDKCPSNQLKHCRDSHFLAFSPGHTTWWTWVGTVMGISSDSSGL